MQPSPTIINHNPRLIQYIHTHIVLILINYLVFLFLIQLIWPKPSFQLAYSPFYLYYIQQSNLSSLKAFINYSNLNYNHSTNHYPILLI